jgi:hypothetical protein
VATGVVATGVVATGAVATGAVGVCVEVVVVVVVVEGGGAAGVTTAPVRPSSSSLGSSVSNTIVRAFDEGTRRLSRRSRHAFATLRSSWRENSLREPIAPNRS